MGKTEPSAFAYGGNYVVGKDVWCSENGKDWECVIPNAPFGFRAGHAMLTFKDGLWLIGGSSDKGAQNDVWFSKDGKNWKQVCKSAGFEPREDFQCFVYDGKIWVLGGEQPRPNTSSKKLHDLWYTTNGVDWLKSDFVPPFGARNGTAMAFLNGKLWLVGGETELNDGSFFPYNNDIWSVDAP